MNLNFCDPALGTYLMKVLILFRMLSVPLMVAKTPKQWRRIVRDCGTVRAGESGGHAKPCTWQSTPRDNKES